MTYRCFWQRQNVVGHGEVGVKDGMGMGALVMECFWQRRSIVGHYGMGVKVGMGMGALVVTHHCVSGGDGA